MIFLDTSARRIKNDGWTPILDIRRSRQNIRRIRNQLPFIARQLKSAFWQIDDPKTPYDRYIATLRSLGMRDKEYQRTAPRKIMEFPAGASWIAITDLVLHGAISGQHSLDQTFYLPVEAMNDSSRSSLRILERLAGQALV